VSDKAGCDAICSNEGFTSSGRRVVEVVRDEKSRKISCEDEIFKNENCQASPASSPGMPCSPCSPRFRRIRKATATSEAKPVIDLQSSHEAPLHLATWAACTVLIHSPRAM
jgi:hypothetical protein